MKIRWWRSAARLRAVAVLCAGVMVLPGPRLGWASGNVSESSALEGIEGCARLDRVFAENEVVLMRFTVETGRDTQAVTIDVTAWGEFLMGAETPVPDRWSARFTPPITWLVLRHHLAAQAGALKDAVVSTPASPVSAVRGAFLFHRPRGRVLDLGPLQLQLSAKTQAHLILAGRSEEACSRRVLIIEEAHADAEGQYALFEGLGSLFAENRVLQGGGQAVFLAEGWPAFQPLAVRPLVSAESRPDESMIRRVLSTYLIPGYVAFEWKHQRGIPTVGTEDPVLYRISAQVWTRLQQSLNPVDLAAWPVTVASRNSAITQTLLAQMRLRPCPILFVGGKHLESLPAEGYLTASQWHELGKTMTEGDLGRLRSARTLGIGSLLGERDLGYYLLVASSGLRLGESANARESQQQYERLFRAQLSRSLGEYLAACSAGNGVTVAPSPEAAARVVLASKGSGGNGADDGDKSGGKPGKGPSSPKGMLDKLLEMLNKLFGDGRPPKDPSKPPGPGYEWRGNGPPGSGEGAWYNPDTKDSFRPHFNATDHADHYDYSARDNADKGWRIYLDGRVEPK
ncbi:MAG TPA: polymorphic toxin type 37 domain-containing protein [Verrucomicrobiota bacterium]|nr:polymorphic toxin type 37 domain-containing protein [Verrucomicrobiota bacterium]HNU51609.1 polymorphic toxin type 37 domain-containing protein [Verrucomicrobiota bacterium]